jgi:quercetin dioxygenase-like cupin family protein
MNNFKLVGHFDPEDVLQELYHTRLWNWLDVRRLAEQSYHKQVDDIILRFQNIIGEPDADYFYNTDHCVNYFVTQYLPEVCKVVTGVSQNRNVGRVLVANLKPGGLIGKHIDEGLYAQHHDRYHLVVTSNPDVTFSCGDEHVTMSPGEIWWFNNQIEHMVHNNSDHNRIHIIVDLLKETNDKDSTQEV